MQELLGTITEWLDPEEVWPIVIELAWRTVAALLILLIGRWIALAIAGTARRASARANIDATLAQFLHRLIYLALLVIFVLVALDTLGVETTNFLAILGAAGIAIGLALKDSLSNFSAGAMLVVHRPFKVGDYVEAGGTAGTVESIRLFSTLLKTPDNCMITVPNGVVYADKITNYSAYATRRIDLVIGVGYDDDVVGARETIKSVLDADERILQDPAPQIMLLELADSSVNFAVRPWVVTADYWDVRGDTLENIKSALEGAGLSIPYPQRDVHLIGQVAANE
jgi:small conductance mechanosensitive channel